MKLFLVMALVALSTVSFAQPTGEVTIKGSKRISQDSTPQQVIDTLRKRFPNAQAVQYFQTSAATARGWAVAPDEWGEPMENLEYYTLKFKRHDFQYYGLFKADGTLVKSEFQQINVDLPESVKTSLKKLAADKKYTDYQIISKDYFKVENYEKQKAYYVIKAVKKTDISQEKTVYVDPTGKIIKVQ